MIRYVVCVHMKACAGVAMRRYFIACFLVATFLSACGGSSGGSSETPTIASLVDNGGYALSLTGSQVTEGNAYQFIVSFDQKMNDVSVTASGAMEIICAVAGSVGVTVSVESAYSFSYAITPATHPLVGDSCTLRLTSSISNQAGLSIAAVEYLFDIVVFSSNLPLVIINTAGEPIVDEPKISATMQIIDVGASGRAALTDAPVYDGRIGVELRGSSSLLYWPKHSFGVETRDATDEAEDVSLLGLPSESDWVLYAPYGDKSLVRNNLAYDLYRETGRYASRARFVEIFVDQSGDGGLVERTYNGVYVLLEKVKRNSERVDIKKLSSGDIAPPEVTGGYILKIDKLKAGDEAFYTTHSDQQIAYEYPKATNIVNEQKTYIYQFLADYEAALYGVNFTDPLTGYASYIDVDAFIDYLLLNEFMKGIDAYKFSVFMYKDRDGKLNMGPPWDYDLSTGNVNYADGWLTSGWQFTPYPFWWARLLEDPAFAEAVKARWSALRATIFSQDNIFAMIDDYVAELSESEFRNFQRWPILGIYVWPNKGPYPSTWGGEIDRLKGWITDRLVWIDVNILDL